MSRYLLCVFATVATLFSVYLLSPAQKVAGVDDSCNPHNNIEASQVLMRGDGDFDTKRMDQYAQYLGTQKYASWKLNPGVLVYCSKESHIQSAIRFAGACGYHVVARSGGHSYTGASACHTEDCIQLDLTGMIDVNVQGNSITAEPGIRLYTFASISMLHGLSVPHGGCATVGLGGHMQSSAWGMMSNSHGSGLDRVSSFRMVQANGEVVVASRQDADDTIYKSVLGSAPGSFGIASQYTFDGVPDSEGPHTRMMAVSIPYTKELFVAAFKQTQFICKDQEDRNVRDLKILLVTGPSTETVDVKDCYIRVYALWVGVDTGPMSQHWKERYMQPFWEMPHQHFPTSFDVPAPLSVATRLIVNLWTNHHDRYAVQAFHSDYWWSDEFIEILAEEVDARVAMMPDIYPNFQFLPLGLNTQWARNAGMNSITWRDTRAYVDDWVFVKKESDYEKTSKRMHDFRERTRKHWLHSDGQERQTFMSPMTTYENSTDLTNPAIARQFFPDQKQFRQLQALKAELDPTAMFNNMGTIPLPKDVVSV